MRIAKVVGTVTLNRCHPSFVGARLRLAVPLSLAELRGEREPQADEIVVWDDHRRGHRQPDRDQRRGRSRPAVPA